MSRSHLRRGAALPACLLLVGLLAACEPEDEPPSTEAPDVPCVGAWVLQGEGMTRQEAWDEAQEEIAEGNLTYRRSFDPTIPAVGNEAWREVDHPYDFYSVKPPNGDIQGLIAGDYDDRLRAMAEALPEHAKFTLFHEPEDNMDGQTFYALTAKTVDVVKDVRPDVEVWYVAMAYQWKTNSKGNVDTNDGWIDAARIVDQVGLDIYAPEWSFRGMSDDPGFQRWYEEIKEESGKPWGIIERGISSTRGDQARADILAADWEWAKANDATLFMYWHGNHGADADWKLVGPAEQAGHRDMAAEGHQPGSDCNVVDPAASSTG